MCKFYGTLITSQQNFFFFNACVNLACVNHALGIWMFKTFFFFFELTKLIKHAFLKDMLNMYFTGNVVVRKKIEPVNG